MLLFFVPLAYRHHCEALDNFKYAKAGSQESILDRQNLSFFIRARKTKP
jgi:hypothetical protein